MNPLSSKITKGIVNVNTKIKLSILFIFLYRIDIAPISLFNAISNFVSYLMPKPTLYKNNNETI